MLTPPLDLSKVDATKLMDFLYSFFHRDFVASRTELAGKIWINPRSHRLDDGKEMDFWHLTTRDTKRQVKQGKTTVIVKERLPDFRRSERIEWVRQIITGHNQPEVKMFYHLENNDKRDLRLYLWAHQLDFVVILQKIGRGSAFLVTSFYLDYQGKKVDYQKRFEHYRSGRAAELVGCEWF